MDVVCVSLGIKKFLKRIKSRKKEKIRKFFIHKNSFNEKEGG